MLIEMGADVDRQKSREGAALKMAAYRGYADVVKMMLDKGIMNGFQDAFELGVDEGWVDVVRIMLENGDVDEGRKAKRICVTLWVWHDKRDILRLLRCWRGKVVRVMEKMRRQILMKKPRTSKVLS